MKSRLLILVAGLASWLALEDGPGPLHAGEKETREAGQNGAPTDNDGVSLTQKDVLSIRSGQFFLDGKPFAEISFNKFDLFWQLYDQLTLGQPLDPSNPIVAAQERALRNLHELGFQSIRVFALSWG